MSYLTGATNAQSLNGILTITDGVITISEGTISGLEEIDLNDLQVADTATIENLVVNNQIDMTSGQIKNVATPTDNGDATNKQFVDTNFLNKVISTTQTFEGKIDFIGTNYTTNIALPVLDLITSTSGASNGAFIRTYKNLNRVANLEIGGLSYISEVPTNTVRREVDLIFRTNANTLAEMVINMNNSTLTPFLINEDKYETKNNNYYILKQDGTQLLYYTSSNDAWAMSKNLNMTQNDITNANTLAANFNLKVAAATSGFGTPAIQFQNTTTGSNNGIYMRFYKNFNRLPNTELGGIIFADKNATSQATSRAVQLKASIGSDSTPIFDILFNSEGFNPLRVSNTQNILSNDDFYIKNKTSAQDLFTYLNASDKFTMYKPLDMNNTNKIINLADPVSAQDASTKNYVDTHSNNGNYLLRNGTLPMTGNLQMGSFKITNLLDPSDLNDGANKYYVDTQSANTHYLLRNGTLAMTGNLSLASHNLTTTGDINCNEVTADGNINTTADMSCADFNSAGNQVIGGGSLNVLDVKSSAFFEANVLIETNKHLAFNSGTLSTTNGMLMNYDGGVGFLDVRGSEFRVRTASSGTPSNIRFKVNHTNTTILNNFFCDADCTFGSDTATDEARFNCKATFPSGSDLRFNDGADIIYDSGAESIFSSGSITQFNYGSTLRFLNIQSFNVGSYINSARINLIRKTNDFTLNYLTNFENGVISDPNSSGLIITMPDTGGPSGASGLYWNRRHYIIKLKDGGQTKLRQNTTTISTKIDENTGDINYNTAWKTIQLVFDENFSGNGQIYIISDR